MQTAEETVIVAGAAVGGQDRGQAPVWLPDRWRHHASVRASRVCPRYVLLRLEMQSNPADKSSLELVTRLTEHVHNIDRSQNV